MHFTIAFEKNVSFVHRFVEIDLAFIKLHAVLKAFACTQLSISKILFCHRSSAICLLNVGLQTSDDFYCTASKSKLTDFFKASCAYAKAFRMVGDIFIKDKQ